MRGAFGRVRAACLLAGFAVFLVVCLPAVASTDEQEPRTDAQLLATPVVIDFGTLKTGEPPLTRLLFFHGEGGPGGGQWRIECSAPWISVDRDAGQFEGRRPEGVRVTVDPARLKTGSRSGHVRVTVSDPESIPESGPDSGVHTLTIPVLVILSAEPLPERSRSDVLESLRAEPAYPLSLAPGTNRAFRALGVFTDGSERDITEEVRWISDAPGVADVAEPGLIRGKSAGIAGLRVERGGITSRPVTLFVDDAEGPLLGVSHPNPSLGRLESGASRTVAVTVRNQGQGRMHWSLSATEPWISVARESDGESAAAGRRILGPGERETLEIGIDGTGLPAGEHRGTLLIRSNGGDRTVHFDMDVVAIETILLTPIRMTMPEGERRRLNATAFWSDGTRTDITGSAGGRWITTDPSVLGIAARTGMATGRAPGVSEVRRVEGGVASATARIEVIPADPRAGLRIAPHEVDLGAIGPGEESRRTLALARSGSEPLDWIVDPGRGWFSAEGKPFGGRLTDPSASLRIHIRSRDGHDRTAALPGDELFPLAMTLDLGGRQALFHKNAAEGTHRDMIEIRFGDRVRRAFLSYEVTRQESRPLIAVEPRGLTLGVLEPGTTAMPAVRIRNEGRSVLTWTADVMGRRASLHGFRQPVGQYLSLYNDRVADGHPYEPPPVLAASLNTGGDWYALGGSPASAGAGNTLKYLFQGDALSLIYGEGPDGGSFRVSINGDDLGAIDSRNTASSLTERTLAEDLPDEGPHVLTIVTEDAGQVRLDGFRVKDGTTPKRGTGDWIRLSPSRGTTGREADVMNVLINTRGLAPGRYREAIVITSDGGRRMVEVSFDVRAEGRVGLIPIYRYQRGDEHFLAGERPDIDEELLRGFRRGEPVFHLFSTGTPGTTPFYAWHHPRRGDWYYSTERAAGDREAAGYRPAGSIGNIALVPLPNTRELYRLYNADTRRYLYVLDLREGDHRRRGYRYDGIAGYVR